MSAILKQIIIGEKGGGALMATKSAEAVEGRGLKGDRYYYRRGSFNRPPLDQSRREVSLISDEAIAICNERLGTALEAVDFRRNLLVEGVDLKTLKGRTFRIGEVLFSYAGSAPPCRYLARLLSEDVMTGLKGIGGIRAHILKSGVIRVGDRLEVMEEDADENGFS